MDALIDVKERIVSLERSNRSLAQSQSTLAMQVADHTGKFKIIDDDLKAYKQYIEHLFYHDDKSVVNSFKSVDQRIADSSNIAAEMLAASSAAVREQIDLLTAQVTHLREVMNSKFHSIATPADLVQQQQQQQQSNNGQDPFQVGQNDPWAQQAVQAHMTQPPLIPAAKPGVPQIPQAFQGQDEAVNKKVESPVANSPFKDAQPAPVTRNDHHIHGVPYVPQSPDVEADPVRRLNFDSRSFISPMPTHPNMSPSQNFGQQGFGAQGPAQGQWHGPLPGGGGLQPGVNYAQQQFQGWAPANFTICRKKNDALKKFTGQIGEYAMWRDRILDHICRSNRKWRELCESLQVCTGPILQSWLVTQSEGGHNAWDLAQELESFLVDWLSDPLYRRRHQLSGGEKGNGFEMWRYLFQEYHGGSDAVHLGGARRLQEWPRCNNLAQLSSHLDDWVECLQTHCVEMLHAPGMVRSMLLGVIPTEYEEELLSKPHIKSWQEIINWCKLRTTYKRQKVLAEATRKPGGRVCALAGVELSDDDDESRPQEVAQRSKGQESAPTWAMDLINALATRKKTNNPKPSTKENADGPKPKVKFEFKGCWHCGADGHTRRKCKAFEALMAKANAGNPDRATWKLPQGYAGKYEEAKKKFKAKAAKAGRVNMLDGSVIDEAPTEDESEDSDTDIMGPFLGQSEAVRALRMRPTEISNSFEALTDPDSDSEDDFICGLCDDSESEPDMEETDSRAIS